MPIDYSQLLDTLIEETFENLAEIDDSLLGLDLNAPDPEKINKIFRAVHTMKGNSAIFKLDSLSKLMHAIETFLDKIRSSSLQLEKQHIDYLLKVSDSTRNILTDLQKKKPLDEALIAELFNSLQELLKTAISKVPETQTIKATSESKKAITKESELKTKEINGTKETKVGEEVKEVKEPKEKEPKEQAKKAKATEETKASIEQVGWNISLKPQKDIFKYKLDPLGAFALLKEQIKFKATLDASKLSEVETFDPLECYLSWDIELLGDISKESALEILTWVFEEQDIHFSPILNSEQLSPISPIPSTSTTDKTSAISAKTEKVQPTPSTVLPTTPLAPHTAPTPTAQVMPTTLRISTEKIDSVMNAVGELFIIESMLKQNIRKLDHKSASSLDETMDQLEANSRYLQDSLMRIRMVPIAFAINRFPRMVFEMASKTGKLVDFVIKGDQTEIDKTMIEKITDPLLHLIRNAIDHGIETPEIREKLGKNKTGSLQFIAQQEGDNILIEIKDDGSGIDPEKIREVAISKGLLSSNASLSAEELYKFIFKPGFSTSSEVTEFSGRGVGLDVVEKNIRSLGGTILIESKILIGSTFKIKLPLTLAIMDCQLIRVKKQTYIIPLLSIIEMAQITSSNITEENGKKYYKHKDQNINLVYLNSILNHKTPPSNILNKFVVVVQTTGSYSAFVCDELLLQQTTVIKKLDWKVPGTVGGTIMGDGSVGLILDVHEIAEIGNKTYDEQQIQSEAFFSRRLFQTENGIDKTFSKNNLKFKESNIEENTTNNLINEFLCFALGNSEYAINTQVVKEIMLSKIPTPIPFSPPYLLGVINLRGNITPVVDLRVFFGIVASPSEKGITIIVNIEKDGVSRVIALIVDAITDTQVINKHDISPIPKSGHLILRHYIQGLVYINQRIITLLQIQNILKDQSNSLEAT